MPRGPIELEVGDLQVGAKLGEGFFGSVYAGAWRGEAVALKFAKIGHCDALRKEVRTLDAVRHPRLMHMYGVCEPDGDANDPPAGWPEDATLPAMVCELLEGHTLLDFLKESCAQRDSDDHWFTTCGLLMDSCEGLAYLHSVRMMHRDIKSINIMLERTAVGEAMHAKLVDFGLSRFMQRTSESMSPMATGSRASTADSETSRRRPSAAGSGAGRSSATRLRRDHTVSIGTYTHMAPEVMSGPGYNASADVFSFGIVISEALAADEADELIDRTRTPEFGLDPEGMREMLPQSRPPICQGLLDLALSCCNLDASARPSAAVVLCRMEALRADFAGGTVGLGPTVR